MLIPKPVILAIKHSKHSNHVSHSLNQNEEQNLTEILVEKDQTQKSFDPNKIKEESHDISEIFVH